MYKLLSVLFCIVVSLCVSKVKAQDKTGPVQAVRIHKPIKIDGKLTEVAWKKAPVITGLHELNPVEGAKATEKSVIRVLYDNHAIYIGAHLYDTSPDSIIAQLGRRDSYLTADEFTVYLDPYNDKQTGFYFGVNAAGTKKDGTLYDDVHSDDSWDGVWQGKVRIDKEGWSVEMRIPYSQLRFQQSKDYKWGIDFERIIARKNEEDYLVYTPKKENGFVSLFPDLKGVHKIPQSHDFEIIPYVTTKASYLQHASGDPFNDGSKYNINAGADLRTSIGSNLTLNATINPDFGQAEVDPAVVNLSDVETFYPEKRSFFIDGRNFFRFGEGGTTLDLNLFWPSPTFFYSRRIGGKPRGGVPDADYVNYPDATHIIGAAKLTGRLQNGWNIGGLQTVTAQENAKYQVNGQTKSTIVQPLTYYSVVRAQKQFHNARQSIGFMSTLTQRNLNNSNLNNEFTKSAMFNGVDGWSFLDPDRAWVIGGWLGMSHLAGSKTQMLNIQTDPTHYLQRPNASNPGVDSSATSMNGYAGWMQIDKQQGNFLFLANFGLISPRFDINDLGYISHGDVINGTVSVAYQWTEPKNWYRYILLAGGVYSVHDFAGNNTGQGLLALIQTTFANYYSTHSFIIYEGRSYDNRLTRGGPLTISRPGYEANINLNSDQRKDITLSLNYSSSYKVKTNNSWSLNPEVTWKPEPNLNVSIGPQYGYNVSNAHYIGTYDDPVAKKTYGKRYVFARLHQQTISANIRVNWTFTPQLSLQLFAQPLISSGNYSDFKSLNKPKSYDFTIFGQKGSTFDSKTYTADPDGNGPARAINLSNPNFNYKSLRGDAVLRWQYRPGSTIYFVWTQSRQDVQNVGQFDIGRSFTNLFNTHPNNIFLVKFSYWFNL